MDKALFSSNSDEWRTPKEIVPYINLVLDGKVELDPCTCSNSLFYASIKLTKKEDGLKSKWPTHCKRVYLNFPYSQAKEWATKIVQENTVGREILVLSAARTDTRWFHTLTTHASALLFFKGRIGFVPESGVTIAKAPFPSVFIYLGDYPEKFEKLRHLGLVVYP